MVVQPSKVLPDLRRQRHVVGQAASRMAHKRRKCVVDPIIRNSPHDIIHNGTGPKIKQARYICYSIASPSACWSARMIDPLRLALTRMLYKVSIMLEETGLRLHWWCR